MSSLAASALATANQTLPPTGVIFGETALMAAVRRKLEAVAGANVPILLTGESGTGKEVMAKLLHQLSPWSNGPFVKVNCPAIPNTLVESELFGYQRGAFTGAYNNKPGRMEMANTGSLFLDEIGEMQLELQAKLLQVLQDGQFCRIGAQDDQRLEARVICATNRSLEEEVEAGTFRQDLYYRINVVAIDVPSLRERAEDIPALVEYFIGVYASEYNAAPQPLSLPIMGALKSYHWPGNVRQLENLIKRYVILGSQDVILDALDTAVSPVNGHATPPADGMHFEFPVGAISLKRLTRDAVTKLEREIILRTLHNHQWNRKKTAKALSISYRALLYKLREVGLSRPEFESEDKKTKGLEAHD